MSSLKIPPLIIRRTPPPIQNMHLSDSDITEIPEDNPADNRIEENRTPSPSDKMNPSEKIEYLIRILKQQDLTCFNPLSTFKVKAYTAYLEEASALKEKKWKNCILHGLAFRTCRVADDLICGGVHPAVCLYKCLPLIFCCPATTCYHGLGALFHKIYKKDLICTEAKTNLKAVFESLKYCWNFSMICGIEGVFSYSCLPRSILCPELGINTEIDARIGMENDFEELIVKWNETQEKVFSIRIDE